MEPINFQIILNTIAGMMPIVSGISVVFIICDRITDFFLSFVGGKRVRL